MRILIDHQNPFMLAHGGFQIQIEQTCQALNEIGLATEYLRWWDDKQGGDVLHFFGLPAPSYLRFAQQKGLKTIISPLLTGLGSRSAGRRKMQKLAIRAIKSFAPHGIRAGLIWNSWQEPDACVALTSWESYLMADVYGAPPGRIHVVPNGVEREFLNSVPRDRGPWLVCTATLTERKRILELAEAAIAAQTPVWIIGKPYAETDAYAQRFQTLARQNPRMIRYEGPIADRNRLATIYREARGFVLLSTMESLSLSALEAAACECPLLLSDLPWARTVFKEKASYCPIAGRSETARALQRFYAAAPNLPHPPRPLSWTEVAQQLRSIYERVLSTSR